MLFAEGIPDSVWTHATCPVILLAGLYFIQRAAFQLASAMTGMREALAELKGMKEATGGFKNPPPSAN